MMTRSRGRGPDREWGAEQLMREGGREGPRHGMTEHAGIDLLARCTKEYVEKTLLYKKRSSPSIFFALPSVSPPPISLSSHEHVHTQRPAGHD